MQNARNKRIRYTEKTYLVVADLLLDIPEGNLPAHIRGKQTDIAAALRLASKSPSHPRYKEALYEAIWVCRDLGIDI